MKIESRELPDSKTICWYVLRSPSKILACGLFGNQLKQKKKRNRTPNFKAPSASTSQSRGTVPGQARTMSSCDTRRRSRCHCRAGASCLPRGLRRPGARFSSGTTHKCPVNFHGKKRASLLLLVQFHSRGTLPQKKGKRAPLDKWAIVYTPVTYAPDESTAAGTPPKLVCFPMCNSPVAKKQWLGDGVSITRGTPPPPKKTRTGSLILDQQ